MKLARTAAGIPVEPDDLDTNPWLLNVANGTVDLRSGRLHAHRRQDLLTKLAGTHYDPARPGPDLLADPRAGTTRPADSRLPAACRRLQPHRAHNRTSPFPALGQRIQRQDNDPRSAARNPRRLRHQRRARPPPGPTRHPPHRNRRPRRRTASSSPPKCKTAGVSTRPPSNALTGSDTVTARKLYHDFFSFVPTHKLWVAANHRPAVRGTDHAIWRRLKLIPFTVTITDDEKDQQLPEKLRAELPGILGWALHGCARWQHHGLTEPDIIRAATADYRAAEDSIAAFLSDQCLVAPEVWVFADDLYSRYKTWATHTGEHTHSQRQLGAILTGKGYERYRSGKWRWRGIALAGPMDQAHGPMDPFDPRFRKVLLHTHARRTSRNDPPRVHGSTFGGAILNPEQNHKRVSSKPRPHSGTNDARELRVLDVPNQVSRTDLVSGSVDIALTWLRNGWSGRILLSGSQENG